MQAAPDGRVYMGSRHRDRYYPTFTILEDDGYAFEPEGLKTFVPIVRTLPHFPNFKLYDVPNSICDTLGIDTPINTTAQQNEYQKVQINPNPFADELSITSPETGLLRIWSINGQKMASKPLNAGQNHIDTHSWPTGMYTWIVILNHQNIHSGKIIKPNQQ
jgi:Secretion system C-terminal sorting domain